jgi:hypothetical protein
VSQENCALNVTGLWGAREHNSGGPGAVCGGHQEDSIFHSKHNQNHIAIIFEQFNSEYASIPTQMQHFTLTRSLFIGWGFFIGGNVANQASTCGSMALQQIRAGTWMD